MINPVNNPPAFPTGIITDGKGKIIGGSNGMTLRDYFAAKAMHGFSLSPWSDYEEMETFTRKDYARYCNSVAESAYEFADAMREANDHSRHALTLEAQPLGLVPRLHPRGSQVPRSRWWPCRH
jgi:hypothetical protein